MKVDNLLNQKNISKGGILGALAGAITSTLFHKKTDKPIRKAAKTGLIATIGYLLGTLIERSIRRSR